MTSRKYYDMELQKLNGALLEMGEMIRMAIGGAVAALLEHDHDRGNAEGLRFAREKSPFFPLNSNFTQCCLPFYNELLRWE